MDYSHSWITGLGRCFILGIFVISYGAAEAGTEHSFKRVKVGQLPLGSRINIQIEPQVLVKKKLKPKAQPEYDAAKKNAKTPGHYDWFWSDFPHDISGASLMRLNDAEHQLSKAPNNSRNLAPSLSVMRKLVANYGTDILLATIGKDISPALVLAVMGVESAGKPAAVSSAGAVGLMQLIPATAKRFNVKDSTDPKQNIAGGVAYLEWLFKEFNHDPVLALAGYNAGENAVKKHKGVPPFAETRGYVPKVVAAWKVAKALCVTPPKYAIDGCVFDLTPKAGK